MEAINRLDVRDNSDIYSNDDITSPVIEDDNTSTPKKISRIPLNVSTLAI